MARKKDQKRWEDMTSKERRDVVAVLVTVGALIVFWLASSFLAALGMVLIGWSIYFAVKVFSPKYSKKRITNSLVAFGFLVFGGFFVSQFTPNESNHSDDVATVSKQDQERDREEQERLEAERAAKAREEARVAEERKQKDAAAQQIEATGELYQVTSIVDGDTIKVRIGDSTETIRFIGVDTPETKHPSKPVQCFGKEASSRMQHYAQSKKVRLEADSTQGDRDSYGRLLRYVYAEDGRNIGYEMIKEGYAHEYTYNKAYKYQSQFKQAQKDAERAEKGLWAASTCSGNTEQSAQPQASPPSNQPAPSQSGDCDPNYSPCIPNVSYDLDCGDISTSVRVIGTDRHRFDRDGDGYGCESN